MPRRFRLPEGMLRRLLLATGIFVPFLCYLILRTIPFTRTAVLSGESRIVRFATRTGEAFRYVVFDDALASNELLFCTEEKNHLAENLASVLLADVGPVRTLPVQVIARAYRGEAEQMLIWRRESESFFIGQGVGVGRILFGVIIEAKNDLAIVRSTTHKQSALPAMILGKEETVGIAAGTGGAWIEFAYVPKGSAVAVGDVLVTSGLGEGVARGFVLGIVREVIDADPSPFYRIKVEPSVPSDAWWEAEVFSIPSL